jgi:hypothetical protein
MKVTPWRFEEIGLAFSSPFQDKSLSKTSELRIVIRRATRLGSAPLELLPLKPLSLSVKGAALPAGRQV